MMLMPIGSTGKLFGQRYVAWGVDGFEKDEYENEDEEARHQVADRGCDGRLEVLVILLSGCNCGRADSRVLMLSKNRSSRFDGRASSSLFGELSREAIGRQYSDKARRSRRIEFECFSQRNGILSWQRHGRVCSMLWWHR